MAEKRRFQIKYDGNSRLPWALCNALFGSTMEHDLGGGMLPVIGTLQDDGEVFVRHNNLVAHRRAGPVPLTDTRTVPLIIFIRGVVRVNDDVRFDGIVTESGLAEDKPVAKAWGVFRLQEGPVSVLISITEI